MTDAPPKLTDGAHAVLHAPTDAAIDDLARRLRRANSGGMQILNVVGGSADGLFNRLPVPVRSRMESATMAALETALDGATRTRAAGYRGNAWLSRALASGLGAAGGAGGLPSAMAELPVTTVVLLHTIQSVAEDYGFDPTRDDVRKACIQTFAAAGPLSDDDGADLAFLTARTTLTGATVHAILARVAPRLSLVLGQKLAAQAVPVLGAVAGAATNYVYTGYYHEIAHVTFGMLRMAEDSDQSYDALKEQLQTSVARLG
ncbi:EcsC family protein [Celeribacter sp.]|uniref:EcsC family protein n=1 Tax=Celeribacter sp. TaxID=1890673 RepID=UPI003A90B31B